MEQGNADGKKTERGASTFRQAMMSITRNVKKYNKIALFTISVLARIDAGSRLQNEY
jgi:hypothetical protein